MGKVPERERNEYKLNPHVYTRKGPFDVNSI